MGLCVAAAWADVFGAEIPRIASLAGTSADWVDAAQRAGLRVALWMVEDLDTWKSCRAKGAATVTSNHPIQLYTAVTNHLNCTR